MSAVILSGVAEGQVKRIRHALHSLGSGAVSVHSPNPGDDLAEILAADRPRVVALGSELDGIDRFDVIKRLSDLDPTIGVIVIDAPSETLMARALEAGARAVLALTASTAETRTTFERLIGTVDRLREVASPSEGEADRRRTIVVLSAKGGAGKTVVAVNLAVAISLRERRQVAIVDLDLQFGDVATALLLSPDHTILDAADAVAQSDSDTTAIKVFLARHSPSDLFALCGPEDPAAGERITAPMVSAIIDALAREFRYQVIDTSAGLEEHTLVALDHATDAVIVVDLDVPSVRGARKLLEALDTIGLRQPRRHIVLNRADSRVGLRAAEVTEALNVPIDIALPSSRAVPLAYNEGKPLVSARPRHEFSQGIRLLADRLISAPVRQRRSR